ncbi:hypothetical protein Q428_07760 [Fervidicella metallireducens AeB]|uniref:DUF2344 domain-containing protein n=1 Tax=Fervidicella metallireducens AeB TaxID=1403537 RepID=A0A017RX21_9CLOT|nr:TIGR03936 family radical SAM-associated protein [Fervidicella metallireducens]EYE88470.1 hypothetical protein Q428_07760 [Fervidicella metallireducens AeB]
MERILIKFTKLKAARFISHLDTMRTLHRAFRRADIPISYSKGFNPHASISIAAPLSLGVGSKAEYADIEINDYQNTKNIKEGLNSSLPEGIEITDVVIINERMPASMAVVEAASYNVILNHCAKPNEVLALINKILSMEVIERTKKTKSGEKLVNIRPLIDDIKVVNISKDYVEFKFLLKTGSRANVGAEVISDLVKELSEGKIFGYADIVREELYGIKNNNYIDLISLFSRK